MAFDSARDFLEHLLRGDTTTEQQLRGFLAAPFSIPREATYHDFKHADEFAKGPERVSTLRRYVTGFANAEGGVLIGGVSNAREITPIVNSSFGAGGAAEWAERTLNDLSVGLGFAARVQAVQIGDGDGVVLLVAVDRAPEYVPLYEKGRRVYWLRMGTELREIPEYLMADLLLGRRRRPLLTVEPSDECIVMMSTNTHTHELAVDFSFLVTNDSLVTAHDVRVGMVGYLHSNEGPQPRPLSRALLSFLDVAQVGTDFPWKLRDLAGDWGDGGDDEFEASITMPPFGFATVRMPVKFAPLADVGSGATAWYRPGLALYFTAEGAEPAWFQLAVSVTGRALLNGEKLPLKPSVTRMRRDRPKVTINLDANRSEPE